MNRTDKVEVCLVSGVEGSSIYINDCRVAGPKPWGGGKVIRRWEVSMDDIYRALPQIKGDGGLK